MKLLQIGLSGVLAPLSIYFTQRIIDTVSGIMMDRGNIIFDVAGDARKGLAVEDLLQQFKNASGEALSNDRMLLV